MKKKLWGGRFIRRTSKTVESFTHSLKVDRRLVRYDLEGSLAHAAMLGKTGAIPRKVSATLTSALRGFLAQEAQGKLRLAPEAEDVHTAIQLLLQKKVGRAASYLHTARSRNDQVVTALRLYCKEGIRRLQESITELQRSILREAEKSKGIILPGYTHLQHAQPLLAAHIFLSYLSALERDKERLGQARVRMDTLPLGSGALSGTALSIDRRFVAEALGFSKIIGNSLDAVTSRDFAAELLSDLAILSVHLSRIAEDLILWMTAEFGFIRFHETLLTGSSMMPQKQNPDFLELVRGGSARAIASTTGLLTLLKGLPSGYHRDLQNDKELLFEAIDRTSAMLEVMTEGFQGLTWNPKKIAAQLNDESLYATDLAEHLVSKGVPFSQAHETVGRLFACAHGKKLRVSQLPLSVWRSFSPHFDAKVLSLLDPAVSVRRKRSQGSTHPEEVRKALKSFRLIL